MNETTCLPTHEQKRERWFERVAAEVTAVNPSVTEFAGAQRPFMEQAFDAGMSRKKLVAAILSSFTTGDAPVLVPGSANDVFDGWQVRLAVAFTKLVPKGQRKLARSFAFNSVSKMRPDFEADRDHAEILEQLAPEFSAYLERRAAGKTKEADEAAAYAARSRNGPLRPPGRPRRPLRCHRSRKLFNPLRWPRLSSIKPASHCHCRDFVRPGKLGVREARNDPRSTRR